MSGYTAQNVRYSVVPCKGGVQMVKNRFAWKGVSHLVAALGFLLAWTGLAQANTFEIRIDDLTVSNDLLDLAGGPVSDRLVTKITTFLDVRFASDPAILSIPADAHIQAP